MVARGISMLVVICKPRILLTLAPQSSRGDRDDRRRDRDREPGRDRERGERRRSRSPQHRSSRRDYERDSYSSSRDYRAREREHRYQGNQRDEREWNRDRGDRGSRRDGRRDDDDRPPRREPDLFDDRRHGGRGGRDRDGLQGGGRDRKKSATPPPKKKEPTPDLTDVVSVLDRQRRLTQWDLKPPGYENVTAEQAKLSGKLSSHPIVGMALLIRAGMFPLPGAPRQQPMDPSRLKAFMDQPAGTATNAALKPSNARQSKRLFVYNLPPSATEDSIIEFFNLQLNGLNVTQGVDPCISVQMARSHEFALLEFKTPTDTTIALAMDGIHMEAPDAMQNGSSNGAAKGLVIRRPKDYIVPSADDTEFQEGVVSSEVPDTANKVCISNIPLYLTEEQVTELLTSFGPLKSFVLVKDRGTEESRGFAFCEYLDPANTAIAVEGLNGMELGDKLLKVNLASIGFTQASGLEMGVNAMSMFAGTTSTDLDEGRVLQLLNMVTAEELIDNDDYEGMPISAITYQRTLAANAMDRNL